MGASRSPGARYGRVTAQAFRRTGVSAIPLGRCCHIQLKRGHNCRTRASPAHTCERARARSPGLFERQLNIHPCPTPPPSCVVPAASRPCYSALYDYFADCCPGPIDFFSSSVMFYAAEGRASINAAAAARMPPPQADARSSSSVELGHSSDPYGGPFYVLVGQLARRVLLASSVFPSSSTTSSASAAHMHAHCTRCASLSPL